MPQVVIRVKGLTFLEQLGKGEDIIAKSTENPQVPGNAEELAAFAEAQAAYAAAHTACEAARTTCKALTAARTAAQNAWKVRLKLLAAKTENSTEGETSAVLSTGFGVKADPAPQQPLEAPQGVRAATNGRPGETGLSWTPLPGAIFYIAQVCADPISEDGWEQVATPTASSCTVSGAEPGKKCWFRIAGVGVLGQRPWSAPVSRPVM